MRYRCIEWNRNLTIIETTSNHRKLTKTLAKPIQTQARLHMTNKLELRYPLQESQTQICCIVLDLSYKSHFSLSLVSRRRDWYSGYSAKGQCNPDSLSGLKKMLSLLKYCCTQRANIVCFSQRVQPLDFSAWNPLADRGFCFYDQSLLEAVMVGEPAVHEFFRVLSLCHTVMSEEKSEGKDLEQTLRVDYLPYSVISSNGNV